MTVLNNFIPYFLDDNIDYNKSDNLKFLFLLFY